MNGLFPTRIWLLAALLFAGQVEAQAGSPDLRHVRWPLLDVVMVPDSASLWFLAAPNPSTTQWETGSHLVRLGIDPVVALQWVTVARKLVSAGHASRNQPAHFTPPLPEHDGPAIVVLGTNTRKPSAETRFILLVSDSAEDIRWKSFASAAQVDSLLTALEAAATASREPSRAAVWNALADREPDTPVHVVSQPRPVFPPALASRRRAGRVWMSYIITAEGRADRSSFFPLLSDEPRFTEAAIQALRRGRYRPAVLNGQPVPQRVFQAILFRQQSRIRCKTVPEPCIRNK